MKHIKRIIIVIIVVLILIAGLLLFNYFSLRSFYKTAGKEFPYPGLEDRAFDMQGITYDSDSGYLFFGGYMRNKEAGPVYLVNKETGETIKKINLLNEDGSSFTGHAGGIAVSHKYLYVAGSVDDCLYVYSKEEILNSPDNGDVMCIGIFPCSLSKEDGVKVSFVASDEDMIYVGEFHMPVLPWYKLRTNHMIKEGGSTTNAVMAGFRFDEKGTFGLEETPSVVYRLPEYVQGAVISGDQVYLSRSFFFVPSDIALYSRVPSGTFTLMNAEVPLYSLEKEKSITAIPMTEEIELVDGKLYIASELSNCLFKGFGKPWGADYCFSLEE